MISAMNFLFFEHLVAQCTDLARGWTTSFITCRNRMWRFVGVMSLAGGHLMYGIL
jgi:hypothetical protein